MQRQPDGQGRRPKHRHKACRLNAKDVQHRDKDHQQDQPLHRAGRKTPQSLVDILLRIHPVANEIADLAGHDPAHDQNNQRLECVQDIGPRDHCPFIYAFHDFLVIFVPDTDSLIRPENSNRFVVSLLCFTSHFRLKNRVFPLINRTTNVQSAENTLGD